MSSSHNPYGNSFHQVPVPMMCFYPSAQLQPDKSPLSYGKNYKNFWEIAGKTGYKKKELTLDDVKKLLANYEEAKLQDIPLNSHVRYFSPEKRNKKMVLNEAGEPIITFKRGGFLKKVVFDEQGRPVYCILSNEPPLKSASSLNQKDRKVEYNWCVTADQYATFYKIKRRSVRPILSSDEANSGVTHSKQKGNRNSDKVVEKEDFISISLNSLINNKDRTKKRISKIPNIRL